VKLNKKKNKALEEKNNSLLSYYSTMPSSIKINKQNTGKLSVHAGNNNTF
jgi:hypothetical protein